MEVFQRVTDTYTESVHILHMGGGVSFMKYTKDVFSTDFVDKGRGKNAISLIEIGIIVMLKN